MMAHIRDMFLAVPWKLGTGKVVYSRANQRMGLLVVTDHEMRRVSFEAVWLESELGSYLPLMNQQLAAV